MQTVSAHAGQSTEVARNAWGVIGTDVMDWREVHVIPRYNAAGVTRFAFLMPAGTPNTVEWDAATHVEGRATFPTGWFTTLEEAYAWLTGSERASGGKS
jgi:hypothetical protein